jgi:hypothetical protein
MFFNGDKRCGTVKDDDGRWVTLAKNGNGMLTGR